MLFHHHPEQPSAEEASKRCFVVGWPFPSTGEAVTKAGHRWIHRHPNSCCWAGTSCLSRALRPGLSCNAGGCASPLEEQLWVGWRASVAAQRQLLCSVMLSCMYDFPRGLQAYVCAQWASVRGEALGARWYLAGPCRQLL